MSAWRWANVPVPEPHVAALALGAGLHLLWPWSLPGLAGATSVVGALTIALGLLVTGWAVLTVGAVDSRAPDTLVTTGPYAVSRNPMYVGWTLLYAGVGAVAQSAWLLALLPAVLAVTHLVVVREEAALERAFGDAYRAYRRETPRYL